MRQEREKKTGGESEEQREEEAEKRKYGREIERGKRRNREENEK